MYGGGEAIRPKGANLLRRFSASIVLNSLLEMHNVFIITKLFTLYTECENTFRLVWSLSLFLNRCL